jgi:hypothetical protein
MDVNRVDHFVGNPLDVRNCRTVDAFIPKFTFSGKDPIAFASLRELMAHITFITSDKA